jgi:hypothetical protein
MIFHIRKQHPVGQGFFHSGQVQFHDAASALQHWPYRWGVFGDEENVPGAPNLRYVYDCGEFRDHHIARDREVERYIDLVGRGSRLDFVFLSHIDIDHVNGLSRLLDSKSGLNVDTIVMPLIPPAERLLAWNRAPRMNRSERNFYDDLVADPAQTLATRFSARQILVIDSGRANEPVDGSVLDPPVNGDLSDPNGLWQTTGAGTVIQRDHCVEVASTVQFRMTSANPSTDEWVLVPHVARPIQARTREFVRVLAGRLSITEPTLRRHLANSTKFAELIQTNRKDIRAAYFQVAKTMNSTTMSLYSGPALHTSRNRIIFADRSGQSGTWDYRNSRRLAWLGTGDAELSQSTGHLTSFLRKFDLYLSSVGTMSVPHHGSAANRIPSVLDKLRSDGQVTCVTAADPPPRWKHPSTEVILDIASRGFRHTVVTSEPPSAFTEWIVTQD